jgi:hypothetical protein
MSTDRGELIVRLLAMSSGQRGGGPWTPGSAHPEQECYLCRRDKYTGHVNDNGRRLCPDDELDP